MQMLSDLVCTRPIDVPISWERGGGVKRGPERGQESKEAREREGEAQGRKRKREGVRWEPEPNVTDMPV